MTRTDKNEDLVLRAMMSLGKKGNREPHGYRIAREAGALAGKAIPMPFGTVYRALDGLARNGFLTNRWEPKPDADREKRSQRRHYRLTRRGLTRASSEE